MILWSFNDWIVFQWICSSNFWKAELKYAVSNTGLTCFDVDKTGKFALRYFNNYEHLECDDEEEMEKESLAVGNNLEYEGFTSMQTETKSEVTKRSEEEMDSMTADNQPPDFETIEIMNADAILQGKPGESMVN